MKIIENLIEKTIVKMIKKTDFRTIFNHLIFDHKEEILTGIKKLLKEAVSELVEKIKDEK